MLGVMVQEVKIIREGEKNDFKPSKTYLTTAAKTKKTNAEMRTFDVSNN